MLLLKKNYILIYIKLLPQKINLIECTYHILVLRMHAEIKQWYANSNEIIIIILIYLFIITIIKILKSI